MRTGSLKSLFTDKKNRKYLLLIILALALLLRLTHWIAVHHQPFFSQLIMDSYQYDRWAQHIAAGNWLGSEVFFQAPLYPYFLASVYTIFGRNLDAVYLIQILFSVLGCFALYKAGEKMGGSLLGLAAAGLYAVYGAFLFYDVQILKTSLAVTTVCFLLWSLAEAKDQKSFRVWAVSGLLFGILVLLRENAFLVIPFLLILAYKSHEKKTVFLKKCGALLTGTLLVLLPVALRNGMVGGNFLPTTFQGGVNFYIGNNPEASGTYQPIVSGKQMPFYERTEPQRIAEKETGKDLSPWEVSNYWLQKSVDWIAQNPLDFIQLQFKKLAMFWSWYEWPDAVDYYYIKGKSPVLGFPLLEFGQIFLWALVGIFLQRRKLLHFLPAVLFILAWMSSTVLFFIFSRYRLPVVPGLMLFAGLPLVKACRWFQEKKFKHAGILSSLLIAALIVPFGTHFSPRMDLVHYNLALIHENQGRIQKAYRHYRKSYEENPQNFLASLNIGNIHSRQNRWKKALEWYQKAQKIEPQAEGVLINLGNAHTALENWEKAQTYFQEALQINPENILALHGMAVLMAQKGKFQKAKKWNQKVLQISPRWKPALQFREKLNRLLRKD